VIHISLWRKAGSPIKTGYWLFGATGFVGKRLIPELIKNTITLRLLARNPAKVAAMRKLSEGY